MQQRYLCGLVAAAMLAVSGCSTVDPNTGRSQTSVARSAGLGALIGGAAGAIVGGREGALIGASIGGGAGALIGYEQRQRELEDALTTAESIRRDTGIAPQVRTRPYTAPANSEKPRNSQSRQLDDFTVKTRYDSTVTGGRLHPKAATAYQRMNDLARRNGGRMIVQVPNGTPSSVIRDIQQQAPNARIVQSGSGLFVARIEPSSQAA